MRHFHATAAALSGLLLTFGHGQTACAQQPAPPPALPAPASNYTPMTMPAPPPASVDNTPLTIPLPPGATIQIEMDIHDDDLLGVYKSFLKGVGQAAQSMPLYPDTYARTGVSSAQMASIISNADLSDVLKGTTHIHFVLLQVPGASLFSPPMPRVIHRGHPYLPAAPPTTPDQTSFYETAFGTEGGHRILYTNIDPVHMLMVSFGHTRGYAFMVQLPGTIAVMRADGYPDLSKLSALMTQVSAAAARAAMQTMTAHAKAHTDDLRSR